MPDLPDGNDLEQFMNSTSEAHSFQDGAIFGVFVALFLLNTDLLFFISMLFGLGGAKIGRKAILRRSADLLRTDEITDAGEYAILGFLSSFVLTFGGGIIAQSYILPLLA